MFCSMLPEIRKSIARLEGSQTELDFPSDYNSVKTKMSMEAGSTGVDRYWHEYTLFKHLN
jgi:hypothetical protein